jgi:hypothetical protein
VDVPSRALIAGLLSDVQSLCFAAAMSAYRALIGRGSVFTCYSPRMRRPIPITRLKLIADGDRFQLYKILCPETAASK